MARKNLKKFRRRFKMGVVLEREYPINEIRNFKPEGWKELIKSIRRSGV